MLPKLPGQIIIPNVGRGATGISSGGAYAKGDANVIARIDGGTDGVFQVVRVETEDVVSDPNGLHGSIQVLQPALTVNGPGPIQVFAGEAVLVFVQFTAPVDPRKTTFQATAVVEGAGLPSPVRIPIQGTTNQGGIDIAGPATMLYAAGQVQSVDFQIHSSLSRDVDVVLTYDTDFEPTFTSDPQTRSVAAGVTFDLVTRMTCAPGTPPGTYVVFFRLRAVDRSQEFGSVQIVVTVAASVTVTTNLPPDFELEIGDSVPCNIGVVVKGGPIDFAITHGPLPAGIMIDPGAGRQGTVTDTGFFPLRILALPDAPFGKASPLTLFWTANGTQLSGRLDFNIDVIPPERLVLAWRGIDVDENLFWAAFPNSQGQPQWSDQHMLGDRASVVGPTLAAFQHQLFMAWRGIIGGDGGSDRRLFFATNDGSGWSNQTSLDDRGSNWGPALAPFGDKLHMIWRGIEDDQRIYWSTFPESTTNPLWSSQTPLNDRGSFRGPSLAAFGNQLFMAWRGIQGDAHIYWSTLDSQSGHWSDQQQLGDRVSFDGPALTVLGEHLYMFWRGGIFIDESDQRVFFSRYLGGSGPDAWSPQQEVKSTGGSLASSSRPGLAEFKGLLYIVTLGSATSIPVPNSGGGDQPGNNTDGEPPPRGGSGGSGSDPGGSPDHPDPAPDNQLFYTTYDGSLFSTRTFIPNRGSALQPALCAFRPANRALNG